MFADGQLYVLEFCFVGMTIYVISQMAGALRDGYFGRNFITGRVLRDTDRYGSPVLFWLLFAAHAIPALMFLGLSGIFGWWIVVTLLRG